MVDHIMLYTNFQPVLLKIKDFHKLFKSNFQIMFVLLQKLFICCRKLPQKYYLGVNQWILIKTHFYVLNKFSIKLIFFAAIGTWDIILGKEIGLYWLIVKINFFKSIIIFHYENKLQHLFLRPKIKRNLSLLFY